MIAVGVSGELEEDQVDDGGWWAGACSDGDEQIRETGRILVCFMSSCLEFFEIHLSAFHPFLPIEACHRAIAAYLTTHINT